MGIAGYFLADRLEPTFRDRSVQYLEKRFDANVQLKELKVNLSPMAALRSFIMGGRGGSARVRGKGLSLQFRAQPDLPPMIKLGAFEFLVDLASIVAGPVRITRIKLEGMELNIPPKGERPNLSGGGEKKDEPSEGSSTGGPVIVDEILANGSRLTMLPRDNKKQPLTFELYKLTLSDFVGGKPFRYKTEMKNAKPPGLIKAEGTFGPWVTGEPSDTPLTGDYVFENADLGVFKGIAGTLASTGKFQGRLDHIIVDGETRVPNFSLKRSGNPVPLETKFHAIVDGRNGNTLLQPVEAKLGRSRFTVQGAVARGLEEIGKTVILDAVFQDGHIEDALMLAMKGPRPFLRGPLGLKARIEVPPGKGEIADRLKLNGQFTLKDAKFTDPEVRNQIDGFSRRGQGRPKDASISDVPANLAGVFRMEGGRIELVPVNFEIEGAEVALRGHYIFNADQLDFHGTLRLQARVSQTMTGWKRWALKPVDPFFAKDGAGAVIPIHVTGSREKPKFGLDRGGDKKSDAEKIKGKDSN